MHAAFADGHGPHAGATLPRELLQAQLGRASAEGVDLVIHTGDFVNFPSAESVAFVKAQLDGAGIPYLYTSGNHAGRNRQIGGSGGSLEPPGPLLEPPAGSSYAHPYRLYGVF